MVQNHSATVLKYGEERTGAVQVFGASENFAYMYSYDVGEGRFFNRQELLARERVCVLGHGPARDLFPILDPIGRRLNMRGRPYRIVGTMAERKSIMGALGENYVVVPWTTYEKDFLDRGMEDRFHRRHRGPGHTLEEVREGLVGALRAGRRLRPSEPDDFDINTSETYGDMVDGITGAIAIVLTVLASIGLLVGGIGVMNIMLISVTERTKEIGVRMALGARRRDVLLQVLLEAGTLTLAGGVVGIVFGYVLSYGMTQVLAFPFRVDPLTTPWRSSSRRASAWSAASTRPTAPPASIRWWRCAPSNPWPASARANSGAAPMAAPRFLSFRRQRDAGPVFRAPSRRRPAAPRT